MMDSRFLAASAAPEILVTPAPRAPAPQIPGQCRSRESRPFPARPNLSRHAPDPAPQYLVLPAAQKEESALWLPALSAKLLAQSLAKKAPAAPLEQPNPAANFV